jgi:membrane protein
MKKPYWKFIKKVIGDSVAAFFADSGLKLSAALSYYTIFSLPPLIIIVVNIIGYFYGEEAVRGELFGQIREMIGDDAALMIQEVIRNIKVSGQNFIFTVIGIVILLIGASGVFVEIQESLNHIWGLRAKPSRGFLKFVMNRLASFAMIGTAGFLLLVSLLVNSVMDLLNRRLEAIVPLNTVYLFYALNVLILFAIITLLFTIIFAGLPDGKLNIRGCFMGAAFTAFLFMIGKLLISVYLSSSPIASIYGAAGSLILILVWVYYSSAIMYFGAEFTKVYLRATGRPIIPSDYAEQVLVNKYGFTEEEANQKY